MAKTVKRKKKNEDFKKPKVKVGRKIKRGGNITNTAFMTKKILLREQLKPTTGGPVTKRHLSLQELIVRLNHHNASVRRDAMVGLKELLAQNPQLIHDNLKMLIEKIMEVIADKEESVRSLAMTELKYIMSLSSLNNISGLYPLLKSQLSCTLTHISDDVRSDSLDLLDIFLNYHPQLIKESANVILFYLLDLISGQKISDDISDLKNLESRSLQVNPTSKLSNWAWRIRLLNRFQRCLEIFYTQKKVQNEICEIHWSQFSNFNIHKKSICGFYPYRNVLDSSILSSSIKLDVSLETVNSLENDKKFFNTVFPLLLGWWIEASPIYNPIGADLSSDSILIMGNIVNVLLAMIRNLRCHPNQDEVTLWLKTNFFKDLLKYIMVSFPYYQPADRPQVRKKKTTIPNVAHVYFKLNLSICEIMICFVDNNLSEDWEIKIFNYITEILTKGVKEKSFKLIMNIIDQLLNLRLHKEKLEALLIALYINYKHLTSSVSMSHMLSFLVKVLKSSKNKNKLLKLKSINQWISHLPRDLLQLINSKNEKLSIEVLEILLLIAPLQHHNLSQLLKEEISTLFDKFSEMSAKIQEKLIMLIASLFISDLCFLRQVGNQIHHLNDKTQTFWEDLLIFKYGPDYRAVLECI